jgi:CheY-like chemotaxis protein
MATSYGVDEEVGADRKGREPAAHPELNTPPAPAGGSETVLVGEDDAAVRKLAVNVLTHYGYRVIEAVDGADAVEKFSQFRDQIDLVLLDAIMPGKNGSEAHEAMLSVSPGLKTLFVSGYARDVFSDQNQFNARTRFLQKPMAPRELLAKVRELLDA